MVSGFEQIATDPGGMEVDPMLADAARQWWVLVLQGVLGIVFGVLAIAFPDLTLVTLAYLFAAWAIVAGTTQILEGWRVAEARGRSWPFALSGVASIVAGLLAALVPGITILGIVLLLGSWLVIQGVMEVYTAWKIRREVSDEWLIALGGIARIVIGTIVLIMPVIGAVLTVALVATWAIAGGVTSIALGIRLRKFRGHSSQTIGRRWPAIPDRAPDVPAGWPPARISVAGPPTSMARAGSSARCCWRRRRSSPSPHRPRAVAVAPSETADDRGLSARVPWSPSFE